MKKLFLISFLFLSFSLNAQVSISRNDSIKNALTYQKMLYPASQYRDIYKNFMQDFYGPGHMINNKEMASNNLKKEISSVEIYDGPDYESTGFQGNFYRVNLRLIADGTIPYTTFLDAFVESVQKIIPPDKDTWISMWNEIDSQMKNMGWEFANEEKERNSLLNQLSEGNYVVHHSDAFNESVNFHYRIISKEIFNKKILPLILNKKYNDYP